MPGLPWRPSAAREILAQRAALVDRTRDFFRLRKILEIDTPILQGGANLDHGVVPIKVPYKNTSRYLPTSPEHPLKRLVAADYGAIWTLAAAFRFGEQGKIHGPEFRMLEWYRPGWDDFQLRDEVIELLTLLTGLQLPVEVISWRDAFLKYCCIDPEECTEEAIIIALGKTADAITSSGTFQRDIALDLLLTECIEPHLGQQCWTILTDYPASACAQARLRKDARGHNVAARFEIYRQGIELANGYWELTDGSELSRRQHVELKHRQHGEVTDTKFLEAMNAGLPSCAGVAVGFDRVVMLALGIDTLDKTQAFSWDNA